MTKAIAHVDLTPPINQRSVTPALDTLRYYMELQYPGIAYEVTLRPTDDKWWRFSAIELL